eukprot:4090453-Pleurochrysis_carterae.AAC.3
MRLQHTCRPMVLCTNLPRRRFSCPITMDQVRSKCKLLCHQSGERAMPRSATQTNGAKARCCLWHYYAVPPLCRRTLDAVYSNTPESPRM